MDLFVYESPDGLIADFRPYLDGFDHAFDDHRPLGPADKRWEKVRTLRHPTFDTELDGRIRFVGTAEVAWKELMRFPVEWSQGYEPVEWGETAAT